MCGWKQITLPKRGTQNNECLLERRSKLTKTCGEISGKWVKFVCLGLDKAITDFCRVPEIRNQRNYREAPRTRGKRNAAQLLLLMSLRDSWSKILQGNKSWGKSKASTAMQPGKISSPSFRCHMNLIKIRLLSNLSFYHLENMSKTNFQSWEICLVNELIFLIFIYSQCIQWHIQSCSFLPEVYSLINKLEGVMKIWLYSSPYCPGTHSGDQSGLELTKMGLPLPPKS